MGGSGSGGQRIGSGPKAKAAITARLHGSRRGAPASTRGLGLVPKPQLPAEQSGIWDELAPLALEARTLTPATVGSFVELLEAIALRRQMAAIIATGGIMVEGQPHPLLVRHQGLMLRVEAGRARFRLAPFGKEIAAQVEAVDPMAEFDQPWPIQ